MNRETFKYTLRFYKQLSFIPFIFKAIQLYKDFKHFCEYLLFLPCDRTILINVSCVLAVLSIVNVRYTTSISSESAP